jgi:hypothetical protein
MDAYLVAYDFSLGCTVPDIYLSADLSYSEADAKGGNHRLTSRLGASSWRLSRSIVVDLPIGLSRVFG